MPVLAGLLSLAFWPEFVESGNTGRWLLLSVAVPFLAWRCKPQWSFVLFVGWAGVTLLWSVAWLDGLDRLWHFALLAMVAGIAATMSPREFRWTIWLASAGMVVSAFIAVGQKAYLLDWIGQGPMLWDSANPEKDWLGIPQASPPAGLFVNRNYLGESAAILIACLLGLRTWWLAALLLPGWAVAGAKGALAALVLTTGWAWRKQPVIAILCALALLAGVGHQMTVEWADSSLAVRLPLWLNSIAMWRDNPLGVGLGSYWAEYALYHDAIEPTHRLIFGFTVRPQLPHHDFLNLLAETGPGALLLAWLAWGALHRSSREHEDRAARYGLIAFLLCGLVGFPLYIPLSGFLAAVCVGYLHRNRRGLRGHDGGGGTYLRLGGMERASPAGAAHLPRLP